MNKDIDLIYEAYIEEVNLGMHYPESIERMTDNIVDTFKTMWSKSHEMEDAGIPVPDHAKKMGDPNFWQPDAEFDNMVDFAVETAMDEVGMSDRSKLTMRSRLRERVLQKLSEHN